jgi:hypothetical protein
LAAVDANPSGETPPQFLTSKFAQGIFLINCANESSRVWLMRTVSGLGELWEGAELTVVESRDLPKGPRVLVCIPDTSGVNTVISRPRIQNLELNTAEWLIVSRKVTEKGRTFVSSIDLDSFKTLSKTNFNAFWGLGRIIFWTLKDEKKNTEAEGAAAKASSQ